MKYLYGASIQGIQDFIFSTGKLKHIVGASELIEALCKDKKDEFLENHKLEAEIVVAAAGNIRLIFNSKEAAETIYLHFPKFVNDTAPGITVSQAVVQADDEIGQEHFNKLEQLLKAQRNNRTRPTDIGLSIVRRSQTTGKPAVRVEDELLDLATDRKIEAGKDSKMRLLEKLGAVADKNKFTDNFGYIVDDNKGDLLAVIHADGNGLGKIIQQISASGQNIAKLMGMFSTALDEATASAASKAFKEIIVPATGKYYPFRPVVLGGDDLTVVCRGDLAIPFTQKFLGYFELETKDKFKGMPELCDVFKNGLTACAGIALVKPSYPFHFAVSLAEELCSYAKKATRECSSLAFHLELGGYIDSYEKIVERELTAGSYKFNFGPYYLRSKPKIDSLIDAAKILKKCSPLKSGIRRWVSELHRDVNSARIMLERLDDVASEKYGKDIKEFEKALKELLPEQPGAEKLRHLLSQNTDRNPAYDLLTVAEIFNREKE